MSSTEGLSQLVQEQTDLINAQVRTIETITADRDRYKQALEDMQARMGGMIMEKGEQAASSVTVDTPEWLEVLHQHVVAEHKCMTEPGPYEDMQHADQTLRNLIAVTDAHAAAVAAKAVAEMEARKDAAYLERNQVVAALAKCFPSGVARTAIEGWSEDWHGCVYIDLPTGQASWHFHDSQAYLFDGLPPYTSAWDGHDTPEKYRRLAALAAAPQQNAQAALSDEQKRKPSLSMFANMDDYREALTDWGQNQHEAQERAAFEKAMNDARFFPAELDFSLTKSPSGKRVEYVNTHLESCWNGWQARAAIAARKPAPVASAPAVAVPEGWQLVPKEPTEDMLFAPRFLSRPWASECYAAMLAAAPQPAAAPVAADVAQPKGIDFRTAGSFTTEDTEWAKGIVSAQPPADAAPAECCGSTEHCERKVCPAEAAPVVAKDRSFPAPSGLHTTIGQKEFDKSFPQPSPAQGDAVGGLLAEMVKMMDDGDEHGAGSDWHQRAVAALAQRAASQPDSERDAALPDCISLSPEMRADGDEAVNDARKGGCASIPALNGVFFEAAIQRWLSDQEEIRDAMAAQQGERRDRQ